MAANAPPLPASLVVDQQALLSALAAVTAENDRMAAVTDDMELIGYLYPNGVFRTDSTGHLTYVNTEWQRITGRPSHNADCDTWLEAVDASDADAVRTDWGTALRRPGYSFSREALLRRPDGVAAVVWIAGQSVAEHDPASQAPVTAIVGALTDTARYRNLEHEHVATMANATNARRLRAHNVDVRREELDHFVDTLCRQLRTPLDCIAAAASTLRKEHTPMQAAYLHDRLADTAEATYTTTSTALTTLDTAIRKMSHLLDDVLQVSNLRLARCDSKVAEFWLDDLVRDAIRTFQDTAPAYEASVDYTQQCQAVFLRGDVHRLAQIFANLLLNAVGPIRSSGAGERRRVEVTSTVVASVAPDAAPGQCVLVVSVGDNGIADTSSPTIAATRLAGTGGTAEPASLGLLLTKELLSLMGGSICIGGPGMATTFTVPIQLANGRSAPRADPPVGKHA